MGQMSHIGHIQITLETQYRPEPTYHAGNSYYTRNRFINYSKYIYLIHKLYYTTEI